MRLFVGVRPPEAVLDVLAALPRRERAGLRWTTRDQWHVTLRFLGEVADPRAVAAALDAADLGRFGACEAALEPAVATLGREVLMVPVTGLGDLAAAVVEATGAFGRPPDDRPFRGHLTLARARRGSARRLAPEAVGRALSVRFPVTDVRLVRSHLGAAGAHYEDLHVRRLGA